MNRFLVVLVSGLGLFVSAKCLREVWDASPPRTAPECVVNDGRWTCGDGGVQGTFTIPYGWTFDPARGRIAPPAPTQSPHAECKTVETDEGRCIPAGAYPRTFFPLLGTHPILHTNVIVDAGTTP